MRYCRCLALAIAASCGGSTEPKGAPVTGSWVGVVGPVGSRAAAHVELTLLPNGSGTFDGTALIAMGRDSLIYIDVTAIPVADSLSVYLLDFSPLREPATSITGRIIGSVMDATIDGGAFRNDQLTLAHQP